MTAMTFGLARAARRVAALERDLGRAAMLDQAIQSDDRAFKLVTAAQPPTKRSPIRGRDVHP